MVASASAELGSLPGESANDSAEAEQGLMNKLASAASQKSNPRTAFED
jgi:hypothetical protein